MAATDVTEPSTRAALSAGPVALFAVVAALYAGGSQLAYAWFDADGVGASFFPAAGVTLAALLLVERRLWPVVLAGAGAAELALDLAHGLGLAPSLGYVAANLVQPLVAALAIGRVVHSVDLARTRHLGAFLFFGVGLGPAVGGALGATTYALLDDGEGWARFALEWWVGDGLGVLVVGSALLALWTTARPLGALRALESVLLGSVAVLGAIAVFRFDRFSLVYVPITLLLAIAFRAGTRVVALTGAVIAFVAAEATAGGHAYWETIGVSADTGQLYLQLGLGITVGTALAMAAEIAQREETAAAWATANAEGREARRTAERADRLRALAEALAAATSENEVAAALASAGVEAVPGRGPRDRQERLFAEPAARMGTEALRRVGLLDAERAARMRAELLEQHAAHLAAAVTVGQIGEATVSDLGEAGFSLAVVVLRGSEAVQVVASRGISEETIGRLESAPLEPGFAIGAAILSGETIELGSAAEYDARFPRFADVRRADMLESLVAEPLRRADDEVIGALFVGSSVRGWIDGDRRLVLAGVAQQCGLALERARLHAAAEVVAETSAFLARLSDRLERSTTAAQRAERLVALLVAEQVSFAAVVLDEEDGPRLLAAAGTWPTGIDEAALTAGAGAVAAGAAAVSVPLRARGRDIGSLVIAPHADGLEHAFAREIAARAAVTLDNALLYERERDVSHELQLGLLGHGLVQVDGSVVAAAYRPGTETLEVGGDWYDIFTLPGGAIALAVGDVVGHGLQAAVAMGQLRGAVRALAPTGSPAHLLAGLDTFVEALPAGEMATVAYVELEPMTGSLRYACAGHPPPLVVSSDGRTRYLWEGRSAPLGSTLGTSRRDARDRLASGETLLLFTDGLVERRGAGLDVRLEQLAEAAASHPNDAPTLVDHVCRSLLEGDEQLDDVCVLMLHRLSTPSAFEHTFPAATGELPGLRRRMSAWLRGIEVGDDAERAVILATSEAAANAVEHAYGCDGRGVVTVRGRITDTRALHLEVRDRGTWREPRRDTDRGRGTPIMRALMDDVSVERDGRETIVRMRRAPTGEGGS